MKIKTVKATWLAFILCLTLSEKSESQKSTLPIAAATEGAPHVVHNVPYKLGNKAWMADLYLPAVTKPTSAVIVLHEGGWRSGSKAGSFEVGCSQLLARHGIAACSIDYRLEPDGGGFPNDVEDVENAVQYLFQNAKRYNINPARIGAFGISSGAHLALLAGYAPAKTFLPGRVTTSKIIKAVVAFCPATDLSKLEGAYVVQYMGELPDSKSPAYIKSSPLTYVKTGIPTLLAHGINDTTMPIEQSETLASALKSANVEVEFLPLEHANHFFALKQSQTCEFAMGKMLSFFDQHL